MSDYYDLETDMTITADDWEIDHDLIEHYPNKNRGWRLWIPKKRWYHLVFRIGPRMKFEWREPSSGGETLWIWLQVASTNPLEKTEEGTS